MRNPSWRARLGCSTSAVAITAFYLSGAAALAQPAAPSEAVEQVVVTGTSIRGIAPIGSNLITVDPETLKRTGAQTLQQAFADVPALTGMNMIGQGQTNNSFLQPTIHQLGGSSSNATMVIIDGHRSPTGSTNHTNQVDPNIIPFNMVEHVEILADGSSSIYGSDAVTGVVNMITRKEFQGVQLSAQYAFMSDATDRQYGILAGTSVGRANVVFGATHIDQGALLYSNRPNTYPDHRPQGGTNFNNFNCDPATIQPNGAGNIFLSPTSAVNVVNSAANAPCNSWRDQDILPHTVRNNAMLKGTYQVNDKLIISADMLYSTYRDTSITTRGVLTATAFGSGTQANPFYVNPPGVTATRQTIRWDADALLGPAPRNVSGTDAQYVAVSAEYHIDDNWVIDAIANAGSSFNINNSYGTLNGSAANLALNGTTNSAGSTTTPSIVGTNLAIVTLPLTAANALDVWSPAASNKTSDAVKAAITDNDSVLQAFASYQQYRASINGNAFELPAGPLKVAFGAEYFRQQLSQHRSSSNNTGPASTGSSQGNLSFRQNVTSAYGELEIPVISPEMNVPLVEKFNIDASGRWDNYDTVGVTTNPKLAFDWQVIDSLKLRGSISTSFVAPVLDGRGTLVNGAYTGYGLGNSFGGVTNNVNVPVAIYPLVAQLGVPGCTATSVTCNIANVQGVIKSSGDPNLKPERGHGFSVGFEFSPDFLPGFNAQVTYWSVTLLGGITAPNFNNVVNSVSLTYLLTFTPSCATPAQISAFQGIIPLTSPLPACAQYLEGRPNTNLLDLKPRGIDASVGYRWDMDDWGSFRVGDVLTMFTSYTEAYGPGSPFYNILNTTGANGSFPSVAIQSRANFGWSLGPVTADLFVNYTSAYANWNGSSVNPIVFDSRFDPVGGGDHVRPNVTVDLNLTYSFETAWTGEDEISLTARNLFNQSAPFYNSAGGWDTWVANPLGRIITVGLQAKY
jgi:iron complex outermembrane receptor protein